MTATPHPDPFDVRFTNAFERLAARSGPAKDRLARGAALFRKSKSAVQPLQREPGGAFSTSVRGSGAERYAVRLEISQLDDHDLVFARKRIESGKRPDDDPENDEYYAKLITPKSWTFFAFKCTCVDALGTGGELSTKHKPPGAPCKHAAAVLYMFVEHLADHPRPMEHLLELRGVDAQLPSSETP